MRTKTNTVKHRLVREELRSRGAATAAIGHCWCGETQMAQVRNVDPRGDDAAALRAMRIRFQQHVKSAPRGSLRERAAGAWTEARLARDRRGFVRYCVRMGKAQRRPDLRLLWLLDALRGMGHRPRIGYSDGGELTPRERGLLVAAGPAPDTGEPETNAADRDAEPHGRLAIVAGSGGAGIGAAAA